ncbi:MAG TPA: EAL domain-containing protein [Croceibacterium sp.]|nr:EAL domain-containing protein [Croceibacterium sp.]
MRAKLVQTLYTQPASLAIGALCGIAVAACAAIVTGNPWVQLAALALTVVGLARIALAAGLSPKHHSARSLELIYEAGAFSYAFLAGLLAALTILFDSDTHVEVLTFGYALAYANGISARNAGRPFIAIGQLMLGVLPVLVASFAIATPALLVLGVTTSLMVVAMTSVTMTVFRTLKEQIFAAEASAEMADKMRHLARTDVVTGLANRAGLNNDLVEMMMVLPEGQKLALFWLDLDRFKEINDTLGHPIGDKVLAEMANRLRATAPENATVARFGGDEFIVVAEVADRAESERLARAMADEVARSTRIEGQRIDTAASMGVALLPDDGPDIDTLMQGADLALYHAKIHGRNQICFFDTSMTRDLVRKKEIEAELRAAIQRDELSIFFQPIVDLETGKIRTFEALVRWFHPEKGELRPDEFIPVAEDTGVIITLGNWITAQAARACAGWPPDVTIAVNLSPVQIRAPGAALGILNSLREANLDPRRLELEVTESLFLDDDENTARFIDDLAKEGVRFALDDFGTGYSSLGYINKFPFKKIKVDRSFVSGPDVGKKSDAIIRAVAEMGATLDMDIVAEGLETIEQVTAVRAAGCTLGQGYYFSRAVPDYLAAMLLAQERQSGAVKRLAG